MLYCTSCEILRFSLNFEDVSVLGKHAEISLDPKNDKYLPLLGYMRVESVVQYSVRSMYGIIMADIASAFRPVTNEPQTMIIG